MCDPDSGTYNINFLTNYPDTRLHNLKNYDLNSGTYKIKILTKNSGLNLYNLENYDPNPHI